MNILCGTGYSAEAADGQEDHQLQEDDWRRSFWRGLSLPLSLPLSLSFSLSLSKGTFSTLPPLFGPYSVLQVYLAEVTGVPGFQNQTMEVAVKQLRCMLATPTSHTHHTRLLPILKLYPILWAI